MDNQEKDFLDDVETSHIKPKKQLSEQNLKHLETIRVKALEKKMRDERDNRKGE